MAVERLIGILTVLLREDRATAAELAERFEVSVRTIQRDVDRLCQAGIPLRTTAGRGGGISIMEGFAMDRTVLTSQDLAAILAGLRSLDSVSGTGYYRQLIERMPRSCEAAGDDCVVIDLASWYGPALAPRLELLKTACVARKIAAFRYCAPGGESKRVTEPCRLLFRWSSWYLWAWCREKQAFRLFKLNRMADLTVLEETFPPRSVPDPPPVYLTFPEDVEAVVRFDATVRWRVVDEYGWESFSEEPDGSLLFRRKFPGMDELLRWTLTFGEHAELLEPAPLREDMRQMLINLLEKYDRQVSYYGE